MQAGHASTVDTEHRFFLNPKPLSHNSIGIRYLGSCRIPPIHSFEVQSLACRYDFSRDVHSAFGSSLKVGVCLREP